MNGQRYYTFQPNDGIRFFALDSTYMSAEQLEWLAKELKGSDSGWKLCFFHHPIYSSGKRHGSDAELRSVLEPLFLANGVDVVFSGHEHFYERLKPQNGIAYFISGAAGKLRRGNIGSGAMTAKGFDTDYSFMLLEIVKDEMYFQTISRAGKTVDHGSVRRREAREQPDGTGLSNVTQ
jgi:3',5'-cyclic AMP phosphodiesterase CpdA